MRVAGIVFWIGVTIGGALQAEDKPREFGPTFGDVNGPDNRQSMDNPVYPWTAVGRIDSDKADGKKTICTGTLVDDDIVLTNAHCVLNDKGQLHSRMRFAPFYLNGKYRMVSYFAKVWQGKPATSDDWAVARLSSPLGRKYGKVEAVSYPVATLKSNEWQGMLALGGYSSDWKGAETAGLHIGCSITGERDKDVGLFHDCDTQRGSSGASIMARVKDQIFSVALNWGQSLGRGANYAVHPRKYIDAILEARRDAQINPISSGFQLCSNYAGEISSAFAYWDKNRWVSVGWHNIPPGACDEFILPVGYTGDIYVFAESARLSWGKDAAFCVNKNAFRIANADRDACRNGRRVNFSKFSVVYGELNGTTIRGN